MRRFRCTVALAALGAFAAAPLGAQRAAPLARTTFGVDFGLGGSLAGAWDRSCASRPTVSAEVSVMRRAWRALVLEGSAATNGHVTLGDCVTALPAPGAGAGAFVPAWVVPERDPSSHAFATTVVRAGLETPREWSDGTVLRVTGGAGRMWGVGVPFRTLRATSLLGRGRVTSALSAERWWYGLPVAGFVGDDPLPGRRIPARPNAVRRYRVRGTLVRLGAEWALHERAR